LTALDQKIKSQALTYETNRADNETESEADSYIPFIKSDNYEAQDSEKKSVRELYNLSEILFNLGSSKCINKEFSQDAVNLLVAPLKKILLDNLDEFFNNMNPI
jgi:hypothetical protein